MSARCHTVLHRSVAQALLTSSALRTGQMRSTLCFGSRTSCIGCFGSRRAFHTHEVSPPPKYPPLFMCVQSNDSSSRATKVYSIPRMKKEPRLPRRRSAGLPWYRRMRRRRRSMPVSTWCESGGWGAHDIVPSHAYTHLIVWVCCLVDRIGNGCEQALDARFTRVLRNARLCVGNARGTAPKERRTRRPHFYWYLPR